MDDIDTTAVEELARVSGADRVAGATRTCSGSSAWLARVYKIDLRDGTPSRLSAANPCDQVAVDAIMGHARHDMASVYRERIE